MKRLLVIAAVAVGGTVLLALSVAQHPASSWDVRYDRDQCRVKAREVSAALGVDTAGWRVIIGGGEHSRAGYFLRHHSADAFGRRFTPVFATVVFERGSENVSVQVSSEGYVNSWEHKLATAASSTDLARARVIANAALSRMLRADAARFTLVSDGAQTSDGLMFAWESNTGLGARFEAKVSGTGLASAELKPNYPREDEAVVQARKTAIAPLEYVAITLITLGSAFAILVYLYGLARGRVNRRIVAGIASAASLLAIILWSGWGRQQLHISILNNRQQIPGMEYLIAAAVLIGVIIYWGALAGAASVYAAPAKIASLESIFTRKALNRTAARAIAAGILSGPLLVAVPLVIGSLHLFGSELSGNYSAGLVFSAYPSIHAVDVQINAAVLGVFGLGFGFLMRLRKTVLAEAILFIYAVMVFAVTDRYDAKSVPGTLLIAVVAYAIYRYLFTQFDLLAALTAAFSFDAVWNVCALMLQPARALHVAGLTAFGFISAIALVAGLVAWRTSELIIDESAAREAARSEREKLMSEFSIAHRVQQDMLPERPPDIPACTVATSCQPAREVGGDLFDFFKLSDGRWAVTVGDVSGKGVPAALYMTLTKGLLVATTQDSTDLLDIAANVNEHLHSVTQRKTFVTMALGAFDPTTRSFDHVRAGHNPIVWRRASEGVTSLLNSPGIGLGIGSDKLFRRTTRVERIALEKGDSLVFYSDGLTEAMNESLEQFGEERLMRVVEECDPLDAHATRDRILREVSDFLAGSPPQDDMTLVVLRVN